MKAVLEKHDNKLTLRDEETTLRVIEGSFIYKNQYCSPKYRILSLISPPPAKVGGRGALFFQALLSGAYWRGELMYFLIKLCGYFLPARSNVRKTTMYSNNFNTTINF